MKQTFLLIDKAMNTIEIELDETNQKEFYRDYIKIEKAKRHFKKSEMNQEITNYLKKEKKLEKENE